MKSIIQLILASFLSIYAARAEATTQFISNDIENAYLPTGFMGVNFGNTLEEALNKLAANGYKVDDSRLIQSEIKIKNYSLDNLNAINASLKFNDDGKMYGGNAVVKVVSKGSVDESVAVYDKIIKTIQKKYKKYPKKSSRLRKDKKNYWSDSWEFKDKRNKHVIAEIKVWKDESWFHIDGKWQRSSLIYMEYSSIFSPVNPEPLPGSLYDSL